MSGTVSRSIAIYIDQASAQRAAEQLQQKIDKITTSIKNGEKAGKNMRTEWEKLAKTKGDLIELQKVMDGKIAPSINQVKAHVKELTRELNKMSASDAGWDAKVEQWKGATKALTEMKKEAFDVKKALADEGKESFFSKWGDQIKAIALGTIVGNTVQAGVDSILGYVSGLVSGNAALSDSMAGVAQTTGLSVKEVAALSKELKGIDTRTAQAELLKIAEIAGQFNVPTSELKSFVEEINKVNVVLGSEFGGGAEEITSEMALLRNVFSDIKTAKISEDIAHISNAIITLAQEGSATGPIVTDFAKRLSPLISTAKLASGQILGMGAALQELAIDPERGATAVVRLFSEMTSNVGAFAKVAGMTTNEFRKLVKDDAMGGFVKVLEGFKKGGGDILELQGILDGLEISGVGAKEVLVKLSDHTELLANRADMATDALTKTDAITEQYNKKNDNLAGNLEKIGKKLQSLFVNGGFTDVLNSIVSGLGQLVGAVDNTNKALDTAKDKYLETDKAVKGLEKDIAPLITRYDELATKSNLSDIEQDELRETIGKIATAIPEAVNQFDNYGNAMDINADKARSYITVLQAIRKEQNKNLISEGNSRLTQVANTENYYKKLLTSRDKDGDLVKSVYDGNLKEYKNVKLTGAEITELTKKMKEAREATRDLKINLKEWAGDSEGAKKVAEEYKDLAGVATTTQKAVAETGKAIVTEVKNVAEMTGDAIREEIKSLNKELSKSPEAIARLKALKAEVRTRGGSNPTGGGPTKQELEEKKYQRLLQQINDLGAQSEAKLRDLQNGNGNAHEKEIEQLVQLYDSFRLSLEGINKTYVKTAAGLAKLSDVEKLAMTLLMEKQEKERDASEYETSLNNLADYYSKQQAISAEAYITGSITEKQHKENLKKLEADEAKDKVTIMEDYAPKVKKAAEQLEQAKTDALQKAVGVRKTLTENEYNDNIYRAQRAVIVARDGSKQEMEAKISLLNEQFKKETALLDEHSATYLLKETELSEAIKKIHEERWKSNIEKVLAGLRAMQNVMTSYFEYLNTKENVALEKEKSINDKKKDNYKKMLDAKRMSQEEYNKKVYALDEAYRKKDNEAKKKQFNRNKAASYAQAVINAAESVTAIWAQYGAYPVVAAILTGLSVAATGFKIASIAKTKYNEYAKGGRAPKAGKGGVPNGPKHNAGGIGLYDNNGNRLGEMEGNEPILSNATYDNNKAAVDALLYASMHQGGRAVDLSHLYASSKGLNYQYGAEMMQNSRYSRSRGGSAAGGSPSSGSGELLSAVNKLNGLLSDGVYAQVDLYSLDRARKELGLIQKQGTFKNS